MRFSAWSILIGIGLLLAAGMAAAADEPYQEIQVSLSTPSALQQLLSNQNLDLIGLGDGDVRVVSRPSITKDLIRQGWKVSVVHPDLESFYASRQGAVLDYGIWHTYQETVDEMNLLHTQYPNIAGAPVSLGLTGQGRSVWAMKISDNPGVQENEPEVLYDGTHHAREIMTVEMLLYFMRYLCEHYGTDPVSTFLVDNRQIWFIPIINPDGFVYNEQTNPNGGGMWRKNRRTNSSNPSCPGVDNNRNYPYMWGYDNVGSSGNPCDETYRGPSAGSEPENQAIMHLVNAHHFITHNSYHSNSGMHLLPWGYVLTHTPDDATFRAIGNEMARDNGYSVGQSGEILYTVNGGSFDWMYGAQTEHQKILSFSTEIAGSGFWPDPSERDGLIAENLHSIIYTTQVAGPAVSVTGLVVSGGDGNGRIDPGETVNLLATAHNDGIFSNLTNLSVRVRCDDPYIVLIDASSTAGTLPPGQSWTNSGDPFRVRAEAGCPAGRQVTFTVAADADGGLHAEAPFVFTVGQAPTIVANTFESAGTDWTQDITHTAQTGAFVRADPVGTPHQPEYDTTADPGVNCWFTAQNPGGVDGTDDVDMGISATRSPDFDLSGYQNVRLSMNYFFGQRDAGDDPAGDFFRIDVSSDAGATFVNLVQIGDVLSAPDWKNLNVNLRDFITLTNQVRFRVQVSDGSAANDVCEGGIDDFFLYDAGANNQAPSAPTLASPPNGANVDGDVTLMVSNANDPEGDPLTYGFRVYSDSDLTNVVASIDAVASGVGTTSWQVTPPLPLGSYYWRAYAADPTQRGIYSSTGTFHVINTVDVADLGSVVKAAVNAAPNPTRSGVVIRYMVPATVTSRLAIYDPQGRLVRSLDTIPSAAGWHEISWDGNDDAGRQVASGSYWVRLWTPEETRTVRVVRIQ